MKSKNLKQLMEQAAQCGFPDTRLRDAAFVILNDFIRDPETSFSILFPSDPPESATEYAGSPLIKTLATRYKTLTKKTTEPSATPKPQKTPVDSDMSFDENKAAMLRMLDEIEQQKKLPDADIPKLLKIEADIRVKLNDKFDVTTSAESQLIIVQPKYNHICDHTGKECWLQTKEYAMERWNLIEAGAKKQPR